jgi:hypothetical protein
MKGIEYLPSCRVQAHMPKTVWSSYLGWDSRQEEVPRAAQVDYQAYDAWSMWCAKSWLPKHKGSWFMQESLSTIV